MQVIKPIAGPSDEWWNDDRGGYAVESVRYSLYGVPTAIASADRRAQADHGRTGAAAHPRHGPACGRARVTNCGRVGGGGRWRAELNENEVGPRWAAGCAEGA